MLKDPDKDFISVNKILGKQASIGIIPAEQLIPWMLITVISYILTNGLFSLGMPWFFITTFWLIVSWWLLTGNKPHLFVDRFRPPPGNEWYNGNLLYLSPVPQHRPNPIRHRISDAQVRVKLKPKVAPTQQGGNSRLMPFQNYQNLLCLVTIKKDGREVSGYLLNEGSQYQIVFGFETAGFHNILYRHEVNNAATALEEGLKDIPPGEKMTFHTGCYSSDCLRQQQLTQLADNCHLKPISVLVRNEQKRIQELNLAGTRQLWNQTIFCTWTFNAQSGSKSNDPLSKFINGIINTANSIAAQFTGNQRIYSERFYKQLLLDAFEQGYIRWELLLNTKIGLEIQPMNAQALWGWLWQKFNSAPVPPIPQLLTLKETASDYKLTETLNSHKHACTILIEGMSGRSSCPEHRKASSRILLPGRNTECGVLTMEEGPGGWLNTREQLQWLWKIMSNSYVRDTEAVVEISAAPNFIIQDNLARQAKQSKTAKKRALEKGQGRDVGAEVKQEESFEAQKKMYKGARAIHAAVTFLVYRPTPEQLTHACQMLSHSFGSAKVLRERNIAWQLWLETLPITVSWLLHSSSLINERRLTLDTETVPGILPLTAVRDIDSKGVEFITKGGKPVYVDLMHNQTSRAVITGESGCGKSVLGWRFAADAIAANIPVVGMDISAGSGSTFETAVKLLGDDGAYYDITSGSSNLLEIPDLRRFDREERSRRLDQWKEFIRKALTIISMGKVRDPKLAQRVDAILLLTLKKFLEDPDIIERYNTAFEKGWKSTAWQEMPTLTNLLKFCTKEQLNLQNFTDFDRIAINQIITQCNALLASPLGKAIGRPSTFSPEPAVKFFALSGLGNEQDQYLMAINAHAACIRNALSHPKSLFIGDELSILFKKDGFAEVVGELCAVGRKNGISVLLLSQDIDSICDCSAGTMIMQNMVYRITGRLTSNGATSWIKNLGYPAEIISQNATEAFLPRAADLYSNWLIEKGGRFWQSRYYPGEMILASVANNQAELMARARMMAQYPNTLKGQLLALKQFASEYVQAVKEGRSLTNIGKNAVTDINGHKSPQDLIAS
ncbi:hypothetical protein QUA07_02775 [Microcoleus sp. T3_A4]|uniref:hypothetical protein n=1 Tax=Microcoleus sp. T3_A4 TaxID=2818968 RepID=UPI002FD220FD